MRIAIVGSGISGIGAAEALDGHHDLTLFEAEGRLGGHTHTHQVEQNGRSYAVDTGFIVYNPLNYPGLCAFFERLGVTGRETEMTFSVVHPSRGMEYGGTNLATLFAQKRNLLRPWFLRFLGQIARFHRIGQAECREVSPGETVGAWLERHAFHPDLAECYLTPLGSSLWSTPAAGFLDFPIRYVLSFLDNHHMLTATGSRPIWRTVQGGSNRYLAPFEAAFTGTIRLGCPVTRIERTPRAPDASAGVLVHTADGPEAFDEVILACHADTSLRLWGDAAPEERGLLEAFPYQRNEVVLHTDESVLPQRRSIWSAWNYRVHPDPQHPATLTYDMNLLQGHDSERHFCVTLNDSAGSIDEQHILKRVSYSHPISRQGSEEARERHPEFIRRRGVSLCGAYWGHGFHEDGLQSGLRVAQAFQERAP